jgi:hypothetical protein
MSKKAHQPYDEDAVLFRYVWDNFRHALTDREKALIGAASIEIKAQRAPMYRKILPGYFYDDDVAAIVATGLEAFERSCVERLLHDFADHIFINRCERCQHIVKTPIACVCLWCGHRWFERRAELIARSYSSILRKQGSS